MQCACLINIVVLSSGSLSSPSASAPGRVGSVGLRAKPAGFPPTKEGRTESAVSEAFVLHTVTQDGMPLTLEPC